MPAESLPALSAHAAVVSFVQGSLLLLGSGGSLLLLASYCGALNGGRSQRRAKAQALRYAEHSAILLLVAASLWVTVID